MTKRAGPGIVQVLIPVSPAEPQAAGLPAAVRNAHAAQELSPLKIIFQGEDPSFFKRWRKQFSRFKTAPSSAALDAGMPLLVLSPGGFARAEALKRFHEQAARDGSPVRWVREGQTVAAYYPAAAQQDLGDEPKSIACETLDWWPLGNAQEVRQAEQKLYSGLAQETDGYLARLDRSISLSVSKILIRTPVTPNHITTASLFIGLFGSWLLAVGSYPQQVLGAVLLWSCCILDGCDGEVARLKLLCSESGALYDIIADNVVHVAIFIAIPMNIHRASPESAFILPGALLVSGLLACMFSVWWLVLRVPKEKRGATGLFVERVASRDFIYLILALVIIGKLEWFLWAAGIGSHVFNLALWAVYLTRSNSEGPALPPPATGLS